MTEGYGQVRHGDAHTRPGQVEETEYIVNGRCHTLMLRGSTVVGVSPSDARPGDYPIYIRDTMHRSEAPLKRVSRFVAWQS